LAAEIDDQAVTFEWRTRFASGGKWRIIRRAILMESIGSSSLICKNTPEICKVNCVVYKVAPRTMIFRCRFATKKEWARIGGD